ncbi:MAG: S46 family peptidase [Verrucomicrobiota bacterium]|nr:S46 family peptidase [Verrucomicrobiota bacterium]
MKKQVRKMGAMIMAGCVLLNSSMQADEGMWLFTDPPKAYLKEKYGFEPTDAWLEHVQKSSVRFNSGGSGSFVSEDGLVMSNHHVGADALQKLSTPERNLLKEGFHAKTHAEEKQCHDLELNVLMSIEDVTERVTRAVTPEMDADKAFAARRAIMAEIEKESLEKTGFRSDVVTLFQGGKYHLYRFKKYTDVRLVFAPEQQIAFFGGDPDNFEYPRYDLDVAFFRAYENGKPVKVEHYLKWSKAGAAENELVFVSGHPGGTSRSLIVEELEYKRDVQFPSLLQWLNRLEVMLNVYSDRSSENARRAKDYLFGVQNSRKAREGGYAGLLDPKLIAQKRTEQQQLMAAAEARPDLKPAVEAFGKIASAQKIIAENSAKFNLLEGGRGFNSEYFDIARTIVRAAAERSKPNGERLREYRDSARESLEFELFSERPIFDDLEQLKLENSLAWLAQQLGYQHEFVKKVLQGKSPRERAAELTSNTRMEDVAVRKELYKAEPAQLAESKDPMIQLALLIDDESRAVRKIIEAQDELKRQAYGEIAKAKFAIKGTGTYPDATFTLRLAFGEVKGYMENGKKLPHQTTYDGLYKRSADHEGRPPFDLPPRWVEKKSALDLSTLFNFVCTADIIGGNSGSPVINKNAEVVGLIFDGNIYSLVLDFVYTDEMARAISVHSHGIVEALRKVYQANELADELGGGKSKRTGS